MRAHWSPTTQISLRFAGSLSASCLGDTGDVLAPTPEGSASLKGSLGGQRRPGTGFRPGHRGTQCPKEGTVQKWGELSLGARWRPLPI